MQERTAKVQATKSGVHWAVLALAVALRAGYMAADSASFQEDVDRYGFLAARVASGAGYTREGGATAMRPPLYPLVLAALGHHGGQSGPVAGLHLLLTAVVVLLTADLAAHLRLAPFAGYVAAGLVAVDPLLVYHSTRVMTETLFTALLLAVLAAFVRLESCEAERGLRSRTAWAVVCGMAVGLAGLCRPTIWPVAGLLLLVALVRRAWQVWRKGSDVARTAKEFLAYALLAIVATLIVLPWAWRNQRELGSPVFTTTHGGQTFWRANNDAFYDECVVGGGATWSDAGRQRWEAEVARATAGLGEVEADRVGYREAWGTVGRRPSDFFRSVVYRWFALWRPWPQAEVAGPIVRGLVGVFYAAELFLAVVALGRRTTWHWPAAMLPVVLVGFTLLPTLYWTDMRMRAPLMPVVALLAVSGYGNSFWQRLGGKASPAQPG